MRPESTGPAGTLELRCSGGHWRQQSAHGDRRGTRGGEKSQVAEMVRLELALKVVPTPAAAADALTITVTHWAPTRLAARG